MLRFDSHCFTGALHDVVLDDRVFYVRFAHFRAQLGILRNGDSAVIERDDALRLLDLFGDDRNLFRFAFNVLDICHLVVSPPCNWKLKNPSAHTRQKDCIQTIGSIARLLHASPRQDLCGFPLPAVLGDL
ncbi:hypothetical protein SDC9_211509 [bioreactor metagenome]|uniref:Uncharacterized protein n=1 Tax=bioreactor metagenome TaxID=1076179 RepID=A0A645JX60_9ZZZZ